MKKMYVVVWVVLLFFFGTGHWMSEASAQETQEIERSLEVACETNILVEGDCDGIHYVLDANGELTETGIGGLLWIEGSELEKYKSLIKKAIIGEGITGVDFAGCVNLESVMLPSSINYLRDYCFKGCENLSSISLDNIKIVGYGAFVGCSNLKSVNIPSSCVLSPLAFSESGVEDVVIAEQSFDPIGKRNEASYIFKNCNKLKNVKIISDGDKDLILTPEMFADCTSLTSVEIIPNPDLLNVTVSEGVFMNCYNLNKLNFSIYTTNNNSFDNCNSLKQLSANCHSGIEGTYMSLYAKDVELILSHNEGVKTVAGRKSTCTEPGKTDAKICKYCENIIEASRDIPIKEHLWDDGTVEKKASYEMEGIMLYKCTTCGKIRTEKIARLEPKTQNITISKKLNKTVTYKAKNLKLKKMNIKIKARANTELIYKVTRGKKNNISVSKTGVITLKKGCKKGTYNVTITAKKTSEYLEATKKIVIKVK